MSGEESREESGEESAEEPLFDLPPEVEALHQAGEPVVVINVEGVVVLMSKEAEELLGVDAEDVVGDFVELLIPEKKRWGHQAYRRGYFAEPNAREMDPGLEPEARRGDGTVLPIAARLEPIRVGNTLYAAAYFHAREP